MSAEMRNHVCEWITTNQRPFSSLDKLLFCMAFFCRSDWLSTRLVNADLFLEIESKRPVNRSGFSCQHTFVGE